MPGPYPLATLSAQINEFGITSPTFEDILASLQASYRQIYGSDINLDDDTQDGQWIAVHAQSVYDMNQALIAGYLSFSPSTALGIGLSSVVKINGIARLVPTYSSVELVIIGQAGRQIIDGAASDGFDQLWYLPPLVTIPVSGTITVTATAASPGAIEASPHTITTIATPVPGWQSVDNPAVPFLGMPLETDATLRQRQTRSTALTAITPLEGIDGSIAQITGVGRSKVYQNDTPFTDSNLIPPHSIAVVVEGGDAAEVARIIQLKKNVGAGTYGNTTVVVTDTRGVPLPVNFFYLNQIRIWVAVSLFPLANFVNTTADLVVAAIAQYITALDIGESVYQSRLYSPANLAGDAAMDATGMTQAALDRLSDTYVVRSIYIGTAPDPTGTADISVAFAAAAVCDAPNVAINLSPTL